MSLDLSKIKILLVEDSPPVNRILFNILESLGAKNVDSTKNGQEAFNIFCEKRHDIIITDWMMEPIDGIEFTNMVRTQSDSPNKLVPILMLTGHNSYKRVLKARDTGITEYLVKPFTAKNIADRIAYVINNPRDFIQCRNYFGPDRRRIIDTSYNGNFRRKNDIDLSLIDKKEAV